LGYQDQELIATLPVGEVCRRVKLYIVINVVLGERSEETSRRG